MKTLPKVPSELLTVALQDFKAVLADPDYSIDMGTWYYPVRATECKVCLAGAVMAKTLDVSSRLETLPDDTDCPLELKALDDFRTGNFYRFFGVLGVSEDEYVHIIPKLREFQDQRLVCRLESSIDLLKTHNL